MEQLKLSQNTAKLHQMFGKRLYSDKYSFISEICQNAVDSHRMAGIDDPIEVGIKQSRNTGRYVFYVKDIGLSFTDKEDFIKKVCTILESGKTENKSNDENCAMGMHGIGSISVSAFNSEWKYTVITPDGKEFECTLKEVEGVGLTYEMSDYEETDETKSVLFEVEIESVYTLGNFIKAMKSKLAYFKDVMFRFSRDLINTQNGLLTLNTEFKLFQSEDFQYSTFNTSKDLHISIDQYSYLIRWDILGIQPIADFPIALKFGMGDGLTPDITRENLIVDENYKDIITNKIKKVATWFVEKYNKGVPVDGFTSLKKYKDHLQSGKMLVISEISSSVYFPLNNIKRFSSVNCTPLKMKGVDDDILDNFMTSLDQGKFFFSLTHEITNKGTMVRRDGYSNWRAFSYSTNIFMDQPLDKKKSTYIKSYYTNSGLYSMKIFHRNRKYLESYLKIPEKKDALQEYKTTGKNLYRRYYDQYKILIDYFITDYMKRISSIEVPKNEVVKVSTKVINRKEKVDLEKLSGELNLKFSENLTKHSYEYACKFTDKVMSIKDIMAIREFVIYGKNEDRSKLDALHRMIAYKSAWESAARMPKNNIKICMVGETDFKVLQKLNLHNFMEVKDFTEGKHRFFGDVMTSYLIQRDVIHKYQKIIDARLIIKEFISEEMYNRINKLIDYTKKYRPDAYIDKYGTKEDSDPFTKDLLSIFHEKKLKDRVIWEDVEYVLSNIPKVDVVEFFGSTIRVSSSSVGAFSPSAIRVIQDVAKYRKMKLDLKHYKSTENGEEVSKSK